jgi:MoaA/NifB/PqqE/SkfB family radical SAM enzyme
MTLKPLRLLFEAFCWCPLKCISCAQGRREYRATGRAFHPEMLECILIRISSQASIESIDLFSLGEPLLNKRLSELFTLCKRFAKSVCVSTWEQPK